jgi:hypothetical protein
MTMMQTFVLNKQVRCCCAYTSWLPLKPYGYCSYTLWVLLLCPTSRCAAAVLARMPVQPWRATAML